MTTDPIRLLTANAALQVLASSVLGFLMLIPMQPWAKGLREKVPMKALLSTHLDWLMLAFMQWGATLVMTQWPESKLLWVAWLLVIGGWANVAPYLFRGAGIDAFAFAGRPVQLFAAGLSFISAAGLLVAWAAIAVIIVG